MQGRPNMPKPRRSRVHMGTLRLLGLAGMAASSLAMFGCEVDSFFDQSVMGRWENTPTTVPILERLVAIEGSASQASVETSPVRPEDLIPEVEAYRLGPGDGVELRILDLYRTDAEEVVQREVDARGFIDLPLLGSIAIVGLTIDEARLAVVRGLEDRNILRNPNVTAQVLSRRGLTFNILGSVGQPGVYQIPRPDYRLLEALTAAGQFSQGARSVFVIRQIPLSDKVTRGNNPGVLNTAPTFNPPNQPGANTPPSTPPGTPPKSGESVIDLIDELAKPVAPKPQADERENPRLAIFSARPQSEKQPPPIDLPSDRPPAPRPVMPPAPVQQPQPPSAPAAKPPAPVATDASVKSTDAAPAQPSDSPTASSGTSPQGLPQSFWIFQDGKWVQVSRARPVAPRSPEGTSVPMREGPGMRPVAPLPAGASGQVPLPPSLPGQTPAPLPTQPSGGAAPIDLPLPGDSGPKGVPGADQLVTQRVIEVPVGPLLAGSAQYNIVIRPGDVIRVPANDEGLVYVAGDVQRPGPYNLPTNGRLTILRAINAAGGLNPNAVPERVDLTRMVGPDRQATVRLDMRAIAEGTQPDIFLKSDDMINVGTNFWAFPLAVIRQGFRFSYGFGFVLDRNFQGDVFGVDQASNR